MLESVSMGNVNSGIKAILGDPGAVSGGGKDFFPPPLTAPGSPRMASKQARFCSHASDVEYAHKKLFVYSRDRRPCALTQIRASFLFRTIMQYSQVGR